MNLFCANYFYAEIFLLVPLTFHFLIIRYLPYCDCIISALLLQKLWISKSVSFSLSPMVISLGLFTGCAGLVSCFLHIASHIFMGAKLALCGLTVAASMTVNIIKGIKYLKCEFLASHGEKHFCLGFLFLIA